MEEQTDRPEPPYRTVLVADPSPENADSMAQILVAVGHRALTARTAADAQALAAAEAPDVVIMEAEFPDLDGFDLAARLSAGRPRLILLSASPPQWAAAHGELFVAEFMKPADPAAVLRAVAAAADT